VGEGALMDPNPDASTHKARFAAFEGATQLREGATHISSGTPYLIGEHQVPHYPRPPAHVGSEDCKVGILNLDTL